MGSSAQEWRGGANQIAQLNARDRQALLQANSSIITDLSMLGPAGTRFTCDFLVPGTLIAFPEVATSDIAKMKGVASAVSALSLQAVHETGTVPTLTDTVQTGGQSLNVISKPPPMTTAERQQVAACLQAQGLSFGGGGGARGTRTAPGGNPTRFSSAYISCLPAS